MTTPGSPAPPPAAATTGRASASRWITSPCCSGAGMPARRRMCCGSTEDGRLRERPPPVFVRIPGSPCLRLRSRAAADQRALLVDALEQRTPHITALGLEGDHQRLVDVDRRVKDVQAGLHLTLQQALLAKAGRERKDVECPE